MIPSDREGLHYNYRKQVNERIIRDGIDCDCGGCVKFKDEQNQIKNN